MGKFMIIFPRQITAEQMGFSFEFLVARIIFALGRTFQYLEKTPKISPKHTHCLQLYQARGQFEHREWVGGHYASRYGVFTLPDTNTDKIGLYGQISIGFCTHFIDFGVCLFIGNCQCKLDINVDGNVSTKPQTLRVNRNTNVTCEQKHKRYV